MPRSPEGLRPDRRDLCDVFVKIGGSILDNEAATAALVPYLIEAGGCLRLMILTGGGRVAKRIKANQTRHGGDFYRFWRATGLCPEINAYLLASYSTSFTVVSCAAETEACFEAAGIAVLAPTGAIFHSLYFLPDWLVTTDSMGLHFASQAGARRYVVVSDVDGIYERKPESGVTMAPLTRLCVEDLEQLSSSKLDAGFANYFRRHPLPTFIVNGHQPARVQSAILGTATIGTEILVTPRRPTTVAPREGAHVE